MIRTHHITHHTRSLDVYKQKQWTNKSQLQGDKVDGRHRPKSYIYVLCIYIYTYVPSFLVFFQDQLEEVCRFVVLFLVDRKLCPVSPEGLCDDVTVLVEVRRL